MITSQNGLTVNEFHFDGPVTSYFSTSQSINMGVEYKDQYSYFSSYIPELRKKVIEKSADYPNSKVIFLDHIIIEDLNDNVILDVNSLSDYYPQAIALQNELSLQGVNMDDYFLRHAYCYGCHGA